MPQPYSYDLPQKLIQAIQLDGLKIIEASILFDISRSRVQAMAEATSPNRRLSSIVWARPPVMVIKLPIGKNSARQASSHGEKTLVEMASLGDGEISSYQIRLHRNY